MDKYSDVNFEMDIVTSISVGVQRFTRFLTNAEDAYACILKHIFES